MKIVFETGECGRCSGGGRFSHNGEHDRCYGCSGVGTAITPRGSRARKRYDTLLKERCSKYVDDPNISTGDLIYLRKDGFSVRRSGWYSLTEITTDPLNPKYPGFKFTNVDIRYAYRAKVLVRDDAVIEEIMREVASRFKGATLVED